MSSDQTVTLQDVFKYIEDVFGQSQLIILDTVEALQELTGCPFEHKRAWDYAYIPKRSFLDSGQFGISRAWVTYVPQGKLSLAALFYIQFYYGRYPVEPALMYGSLNPGVGRTFSAIDSGASSNTILGVERGSADFEVEPDGPFSIIKSKRDGCFSEAILVRVPLTSIASRPDLDKIVIEPLTALVKGQVEDARKRLTGVATISWPVHPANIEDQEEGEEPEMP